MAGKRPDTIVEKRDEVMVSLTSESNPTLRIAHFLKPLRTFMNQEPLLRPPLVSSRVTDVELGEWPLKLVLSGWIDPRKNWESWVDEMHSAHQSTWKKAGIYEAIICSKYQTRRNHDVFWGLAEKWYSSTNSFIFPWGEATITLEDIMILGGFSVLGEPVTKPLETPESVKIEENLIEIRNKMKKNYQQEWIKEFMGRNTELEHVAFLALWLSRYVFAQRCQSSIAERLFPIAIHLACGTRIALAPPVLASIYRDLSLLKETIVASTSLGNYECEGDILALTLQAPLRLVQVWAWERFPGLRPEPKALEYGHPRMARWNRLKKIKLENVRLLLDSAQDSFQWRPYTTALGNWVFPKFYPENEEWMLVDPHLDQQLQSFARCLIVSELVGIECVEQYLPHRVAMQFGIDQDLPFGVVKSSETPETAWSNYSKPIWNTKLYVPSRLFEADVTTRYLRWWYNPSLFLPHDAFNNIFRRPRSLRNCRKPQLASKVELQADAFEVPPGFPPKCNKVYRRNKQSHLSSDRNRGSNDAEVPPNFPLKSNLIGNNAKVPPGFLPNSNLIGNYAEVPPGFPSKIPGVEKNEAVMIGSMGAAKEISVSNTPRINDSDGGGARSHSAAEIPGLDLERRISRLEKVVAELKARRSGYMVN